MEIVGDKIRLKPQELAQILYAKGMQRERIVLEVLRYTIDKEGVLRNRNGKKVGSLDRQGYEKIYITLLGKKTTVFTHRIQAYNKFKQEMYKKGIQVRHLNDVKTDNSYDNIELGTARDNYQDRGLDKIRASQKVATEASKVYSDELVKEIKQYYKDNNNKQKQTMQKYNISNSSTLWYILNKR